MAEWDVAIVGAGAAGIAAARRVADRGRAVLLVEALDRLGGRAHTMHLASFPCDLGCGWLHSAERNPWVEVAETTGAVVDRSPSAWNRQYRNLGFPEDEQQAAAAAMAAFGARLRSDPPASDRAGDAVDPACRWAPYVEALSSYLNGAQLAQLSVADYLAYEDAASDRNWRLPAGYGTLVAGEGRGIEAALATRVTGIDHAAGGVVLATDRGTIRAHAAILTVSTDVLAAGTIRLPTTFAPAIEAAAALPLGLADKVFLHMAEPEALPPETHLLGNPHVAATGSYYLRPFGRPLIEVFLGGAAAHALEADGSAVDFAIGELEALLGTKFTDTLSPLATTCWARQPTIRGSYSHALPGHAGARAILSAPRDDRILIAGEACSGSDFSTAHGAYATGVAAADRLETILA